MDSKQVSQVKQVMQAAGLMASAGDAFNAMDLQVLKNHAYFKGISHSKFAYGMAHDLEGTLRILFPAGAIDNSTLIAAQKTEEAERKRVDAEALQRRQDEEAEIVRLAAEQLVTQQAADAEALRVAQAAEAAKSPEQGSTAPLISAELSSKE